MYSKTMFFLKIIILMIVNHNPWKNKEILKNKQNKMIGISINKILFFMGIEMLTYFKYHNKK
jgi:hypothetical protein